MIDADQSSSPFIQSPSVNAKPLRGKTVAFVADSFSNPDDLQVYAAFVAAAKAAGMTPRSFNGNGNSSGYVQAMTEAIAEKPAGIVMEAIDPWQRT
jgi:ribose transport system substrate-binding protein